MLFLLPSFTRGSSSRPKRDQRGRSAIRKRNFWFAEEGTFEEEFVSQQAEQEAGQEAAREKAARAAKRAARNPSWVPRVNYETMNSVEYSALRQQDWFSEARDEELEDTRFWCAAQKGINEDIYRPMSQRVCYMHVLDRTHLRKKAEYFGDALGIMKRLGLFPLMDIQCPYNEKIIQHFYATLAFKGNEALSFRWMCGDTMRESDFYEFAQLLNYDF
jgi:hypothetical protein